MVTSSRRAKLNKAPGANKTAARFSGARGAAARFVAAGKVC